MKRILLLIGALALCAAPGAAADVSGEWQVTVDIAGNTGTPTIVLRQEGSKLTGTYKGMLGESPLKGTVEGDKVRWEFQADFNGEKFQVVYTGTYSGSEMKGVIDFGGQAEGTFTAKKK